MQTLNLTKKYEKYPEYKDSGVEWLGMVPNNWEVLRGKTLFKNEKDINKGMKNDNVLSLTMGGVINRDKDNNDGLLPSDYQTFQIFEKDDLVFKLIDLDNYKTSRVGLVHEKGIMSSAYIRLISKDKRIVQKYFYYLYYHFYIRGIYNILGSGVRSTLNPNDLMSMDLVLPTTNEQKSIVKCLDEKISLIDQIIEKKEKQVELLKEKRTAVINQAVTKGLDMNVEMVDSSIEYIGEIPKSWKMRKIFHLFNIIGSGTTPDEKYLTESDDGIPWVNTGDLTDSYIKTPSKKVVSEALKDISTLRLYSENAIVIAMYGATIGKLGIPQFKFCSNQACCILEKPTKDTLEKYIYYWLLGNKKNIVELGVGGGQPNINKEIVKSLKVSIPNISEQEKIILYLDKVVNGFDQTIKIVETSIDKLKEFKTSLISNVVTGKIKI